MNYLNSHNSSAYLWPNPNRYINCIVHRFSPEVQHPTTWMSHGIYHCLNFSMQGRSSIFDEKQMTNQKPDLLWDFVTYWVCVHFWQHLAQNAQFGCASHLDVGRISVFVSRGWDSELISFDLLKNAKHTNNFYVPKIPDSMRGKAKQRGKQTKFPYPSSSPSPSARKTSNQIAKPQNRWKQKQEIKNNVNRLKSKWTTQMVPNHPFDGWNSSQTQSTSKHIEHRAPLQFRCRPLRNLS